MDNKDDSDFEEKWSTFEGQFCDICQRMDRDIESAEEDAQLIYKSIDRFIEKGKEIDITDEHARHLMAYNFLLTDEVIHQRMNIFSIIALIEILDKNDKVAKAVKGHAKNHAARDFVQKEWMRYRHEYRNNKSEFTRHYVKRVFNELGVTVTEKQMREVWLQDTQFPSKPDGMPADGE